MIVDDGNLRKHDFYLVCVGHTLRFGLGRNASQSDGIVYDVAHTVEHLH